jgi:hypothetical protein
VLINVKLFNLIRGKGHSVNHETEWVCGDE